MKLRKANIPLFKPDSKFCLCHHRLCQRHKYRLQFRDYFSKAAYYGFLYILLCINNQTGLIYRCAPIFFGASGIYYN